MLIGIVLGLYQLKVLKHDISIRVQRESLLLSLKILEDKLTQFDKDVRDTFNSGLFNDYPKFHGEVSGFTKADIKCKNNWLTEINSNEHFKFSNSVDDCLCHLERFAQYVLSGICDEHHCYKLEGSTFIHNVELFQIYVANARENDHDKTYEYIVKLYNHWSKKTKHDKLLKNHQELNEELKQADLPKSHPIIGKS
ncbi:hypothetical protein SOPP22_09270 [Shewanella sp. OPT22]|nr:hypothetical protein SOPP22_09270 [Shewanella sp. OPT22]